MMQRMQLEDVRSVVKEYFEKIYGCTKQEVSFHYGEDSVIYEFLVAAFQWSKEGTGSCGNGCYQYMLLLMSRDSELKEIKTQEEYKRFWKYIKKDTQILLKAEDCYRTIVAFCYASDLAYQYLLEQKKKDIENHSLISRMEMDRMAYDTVLQLITSADVKKRILKMYTYMVPVIYIDILDISYCTERIISGINLYNQQYCNMLKRKNGLFHLINNGNYVLEQEEGSGLYNEFVEVCREYKNQLLFPFER